MAWNPPSYVNHATYDEFKSATIGQGWDMDGSFGAQCYDGMALLWYQYGQFLSTGNTGGAYGCWTVGWARVQNGSGAFSIVGSDINDIKRGDIVVLDTYLGNGGHIGIADEDYRGDGTLAIYGQNQYPYTSMDGGQFVVTRFNNFSSLFLGTFRNDEWASPQPQPVWGTHKKRGYPFIIAKHHWNQFR